ncbi:MAG: hypothetical protein HY965_05655, partial [Ignavibacteriales bacterium]|nr:hypothetical protein [Ignavibacteriales bacterium]
MDTKIALNLKKTGNNITKTLKRQPFNLRNRFSISSGVDKLRRENKFKDVREQQKGLRESVNGSSLDPGTKSNLNSQIRKLKEWKSLDIYRKASGGYDKQKDSSGQSAQKGVDDLVSKIKGAQDLGEFKEAGEQLESLKRETSSRASDLVKKAQEMFELRLEMSLAAKNSKLKEGLESSGMSEEELKKLKEALASLGDSEDYRDFSKESEEIKERSEQENKDMLQEERELLEAKAYQLAESKEQEIVDELEKTSLSEAQKEDFLDTLDNMDSFSSAKKLESDSRKLEDEIDKFLEQGSISSEARDDLAGDVSDLGDILSYGMELARSHASAQAVAMEQWEDATEETSLNKEEKDVLTRLAAELSKADSLSEIREIQEAIENEIESLANSGSWQQDSTMASAGADSGTGAAGVPADGASGAGSGSIGSSGSGVPSGARSGAGRSSGSSGVRRGSGARARSIGRFGASSSGGGTTGTSATSAAGSTSGSTGSTGTAGASAGTDAAGANTTSITASSSGSTGSA